MHYNWSNFENESGLICNKLPYHVFLENHPQTMCPATHFGNEQSMNLQTSRQVLSAKLQACHSGNLKERRKKIINHYNYWSSRRAEVWRYEKSFINSRGTWLEPCSTSIWFALHAAGSKLQRFQWPRLSAEGGANPWWNCNILKLLHIL